eukprot:COSAG05_NODE_2597_length_2860_cov_2.626222_3_plen_220_part_00
MGLINPDGVPEAVLDISRQLNDTVTSAKMPWLNPWRDNTPGSTPSATPLSTARRQHRSNSVDASVGGKNDVAKAAAQRLNKTQPLARSQVRTPAMHRQARSHQRRGARPGKENAAADSEGTGGSGAASGGGLARQRNRRSSTAASSSSKDDFDAKNSTAAVDSAMARPSGTGVAEEVVDRSEIERNAEGEEEAHSASPELWNIDGTEMDLNAKYLSSLT